MAVRNILLSLMLAVMTCASFQAHSAIRRHELKNAQLQQRDKLADLEVKISAQEALIDALVDRGSALYSKIAHYINRHGLGDGFDEQMLFFEKAIEDAIGQKKDLKDILAQEIVGSYERKVEINRMKFTIVRFYVEYGILEQLLNEYYESLRELLEIEQELKFTY